MAEFDAAEIARDVVELYEPLAEEKGLALAVQASEAVPVIGSRELISQALANLIDNAIKYAGPEQGRGTLDNGARASPDVIVSAGLDGERVLLAVADRGPGIPESDRARVVERFVRLEQSRTQPGLGLGLSLASAVARLHRGVLTLDDNEPGLRATIVLPRAAEPQHGLPSAIVHARAA
jgi:signal transduction histidine kinase